MKNGFTLIEMAIVLLVAGIVLAAVLQLIDPILEREKLDSTKTNMDKVIVALASFAHANNRIPCPADPDQIGAAEPYGAELGSGGAGTNIGACGGAAEGVVPFRTLGLLEREVRDGWGRMLTYHVSPDFTQDSTAGDVHARCRRETLWFNSGGAIIIGGSGGNVDISDNGNINIGGGGVGGVTLSNRNGNKARFCCPNPTNGVGTDIVVNDQNGNALWLFPRDGTAGNYGDVDTVVLQTDAAVNANVTAPAMILISHGENGIGAYMPDGSQLAGAGSADETENRDADNIFVSRPYSEGAGANYFDDIVIWRTQDMLYAEAGSGSCGIP